MKKDRRIWWVVISGVLIAAIIVGTVSLVSSQKKDQHYYDQMKMATYYLDEMNYEKVIEAYKTAIELKPEDPEPYIGLAEVYMDNKQYYEAKSVVELGLGRIGDRRFMDLMKLIELARMGDQQEQTKVNLLNKDYVAEGTDLEKLAVKPGIIGTIADFCYQEYINTYGDTDMSYVSAEEGYKAKFKGLKAYAYFRNTSENKSIINETTRVPEKLAKPYKVIVPDLSLMFVGFEGYISYDKLSSIFGIHTEPVYDEGADAYYLDFEYLDCHFHVETDAKGNIYKKDTYLEVSPLNPIKEDWVEKTEEDEEEEEETGTFILGGETYSYDVITIQIYGIFLPDVSELENCKKLETLYLVDCGIADISPLAGCENLVELCLDDNPFTDLSPLAGLKKLRYLQFHESGVTDISPVYDLDLDFFNPCSDGVTYEQVFEYKERHPECICYYDYYRL